MAETDRGAVETIAERAARNQSTFRDANERIEEAARGMQGFDDAPFICECPQRECTELVTLALRDYEAVRSRGERFLVAPGHEVCEVEGVQVARVVERHETYSVMDKVGVAAEVAGELDPREASSV